MIGSGGRRRRGEQNPSKRMRYLLLLAMVCTLTGCAKKTSRVQFDLAVEIPSTDKGAWIDPFGSNFTTGMLLRSLNTDGWRKVLVPASAGEVSDEARLLESWRVEKFDFVNRRDDGNAAVAKCIVSITGSPSDDVSGSMDRILTRFEALCVKMYGPKYAPYVRRLKKLEAAPEKMQHP